MKRRRFLRYLQQYGVYVLREGAKHSIIFRESNRQQQTLPRHPEIKPGLIRAICKGLAIPAPSEK